MDPTIAPLVNSVLLEFRGANLFSFRDDFALSLLATRMSEPDVPRSAPWREGGHPLSVLPVVGLFGANASGKTNMLRAMAEMREHVRYSFRKGDPEGGFPRSPFLLSPDGRERPSRYEVDVVIDGVRHEYGFEADDERVLSEWAFRYPKGRASLLFIRDGATLQHPSGMRSQGRRIEELLRPNALFLSTAASANHEVLMPLYEWFGDNMRLAEANNRAYRQARTLELIANSESKSLVLSLLQAADLGITDVTELEMDAETAERIRRAVRVLQGRDSDSDDGDGPTLDIETMGLQLEHRGADGDVRFHMGDESLGTLVWLGVIGPVVDALASGGAFLADEIDSSLHPELVERLIRLFQDAETNPQGAQLIFNSHQPNLLGSSGERLLGRDQVWFTEKLDDGSTRLFPLTDFDPRREESVSRRYREGRYGAVPILDDRKFEAAVHALSGSA